MDLEEQYEKIYRYCYFRLRHQQMAEDITQETFLRFLESGNYCERGKKLRYLYTIVRNLCIDECRGKKAEPLSDEIPAEPTEEAPEDQMLTGIAVKAALSELEEEEQELLLLRYVNELSIAEICGILKLSRFAVYRKIQKALKRLRNLLDKADFGSGLETVNYDRRGDSSLYPRAVYYGNTDISQSIQTGYRSREEFGWIRN